MNAGPEQDGSPDPAERWSALVVAAFGSFLTPFMLSSVNVALPTIGREFQTDAVLLSWVATSYLLAAAVSLLPFGRLADIHGRKKVQLAGMVLFTLTSVLAGAAGSAESLIVCRVFQGVGIAMIFATGIAILASVSPSAERGRVLGITVAAVYSGLACGPFAGGWLTQHLSWRAVFLVNAPMGLLLIALILWKLKGEWAGARGESFDLAGAILYGGAVVAFMIGASGLPSLNSAALAAGGLFTLGVFAWWELRVRHPLFEMRLFSRNRVFAFSCVAALIHYSATFGVTFLVSLFLQYVQGMSPQDAGMAMIAQPVMMAVCSPFAGRVSDRTEPRWIASLGMAITAAGLLLLGTVSADTGTAFVIGCLAALGFGFGLFSSPNMNAILGAVERRHYGIASGSVGTMRLLGQILSMAIATLMFALFIGRAPITPELTPAFVDSVRMALRVFAGLCLGGIYFSLARGRLHSKEHP
jgi:EmrB/QacA subfamily drug resistance transporter